MSDDLAHIAGETAMAVERLVQAKIEGVGAGPALEELEGWLCRLTDVSKGPPSAMKDVAIAGADHPRGPASNPFGGSAPISREAIRGVAVQRAKRVLAREYGIIVPELERRLGGE